jgi:hypothetical protein
VSTKARDKLDVIKENLGYDTWEEFLLDLAEFVEDNMDDFDAAFPLEEENTEEDDEDDG